MFWKFAGNKQKKLGQLKELSTKLYKASQAHKLIFIQNTVVNKLGYMLSYPIGTQDTLRCENPILDATFLYF